MSDAYRLFVNEDRTMLVRLWESGACEVSFRLSPSFTWDPPIYLSEELVPQPQEGTQ